MQKYVLIIRTEGDGDDFGNRITSIRFETSAAALEAAEWLHQFPLCKTFLVKDGD